MSSIYNPKSREGQKCDRDESSALRSYLRLRALGAGESRLNARQIRSMFGVNGSATHDRIATQLHTLRDADLITFQRIDEGGFVAYRIVLELMQEELPENALRVPKSITNDMTDAQKVSQLFLELEHEKLGIQTLFTVKDWQNCRRLLNDNSLAVVKGAVRRFWETKADQRVNPNFNEFKFHFARLANDAADELEIERAYAREAEKKNRPAQTHREYLEQEIKANRAFPIIAARYQKELEELNIGEEE
jgi:hypothetical protein